MITKWIFLESTQEGLSKNVKDGIYKPLGHRDFIQNLSETFFWHTLYFIKALSFELKQNHLIPAPILYQHHPLPLPTKHKSDIAQSSCCDCLSSKRNPALELLPPFFGLDFYNFRLANRVVYKVSRQNRDINLIMYGLVCIRYIKHTINSKLSVI